MQTPSLLRPRLRVVGGVCAGFAEHTGVPVSVVRSAALLLTLCGGAGALLYAWLWATTPARTEVADAPPSARLHPVAPAPAQPAVPGRVTEILLGIALLAAAAALLASRLGVPVPLAVVIPAIVVLAGAAMAWRQFAELRSGVAQSSPVLVRALAALVLVTVGILLFFVTSDRPDIWTVVIASATVLVAVAVVVAPWLVRLNRDLSEERAARVRESERAEIAAHLHDSVLQTLALIQQKAGPSTDVARLARAQERDLRDWLFTGSTTSAADAGAALRAFAAEIEQDFPVRFDVVTVGSVTAPLPEAIAAAAREAMLNAARHAGGDVSVYLESGEGRTELVVTDRGPGFALEDVPADRMGVRGSIAERMRRAGGAARITSGPGGRGTSVTLTISTPADETGSHAER
ncbi:ATP-binding protein [Naasia aerilata]|uniref:ATP-binding protein n=1 Tax=Naasia aerilata TaxID=1162966 RepID=UPI0025727DBD|nr:ATP-binding protein [Naasia aerilata]